MKGLLAIIFFSINSLVLAQNIQFSQAITNAHYINPALVGGSKTGRVILSNRNQWMAINGGYRSIITHYDHNLQEKKILNDQIGIGITTALDVNGKSRYSTRSVIPAISVKQFIVGDLRMKIGIGLGINSLGYNYERIQFSDEIYSNEESVEAFNPNSITYLGVNSGFSLFTQKLSLAFSIRNINEPNIALIGDQHQLFRSYHTFIVYNLLLEDYDGVGNYLKKWKVGAYLKGQHRFDQFEIGTNYFKDNYMVGAWYRSLPFKTLNENVAMNNDALILSAGYIVIPFKFYLSYDITTSRLFWDTGNTIELSILFEYPYNNFKTKKTFKYTCPIEM